MCVSIGARQHVCTHVCLLIYVCIHVWKHVCMHIRMDKCRYQFLCVLQCTCACVDERERERDRQTECMCINKERARACNKMKSVVAYIPISSRWEANFLLNTTHIPCQEPRWAWVGRSKGHGHHYSLGHSQGHGHGHGHGCGKDHGHGQGRPTRIGHGNGQIYNDTWATRRKLLIFPSSHSKRTIQIFEWPQTGNRYASQFARCTEKQYA